MCLEKSVNDIKFAPEGGVEVYKVLFITNDRRCFTPYMKTPVELGGCLHSMENPISALGSLRVNGEGVHAYTTMENAVACCEYLHKTYINNCKGDVVLVISLKRCFGRFVVVKAHVPSQTPYYVGRYGGEIAAGKMIISDSVLYTAPKAAN